MTVSYELICRCVKHMHLTFLVRTCYLQCSLPGCDFFPAGFSPIFYSHVCTCSQMERKLTKYLNVICGPQWSAQNEQLNISNWITKMRSNCQVLMSELSASYGRVCILVDRFKVCHAQAKDVLSRDQEWWKTEKRNKNQEILIVQNNPSKWEWATPRVKKAFRQACACWQ